VATASALRSAPTLTVRSGVPLPAVDWFDAGSLRSQYQASLP
jgi:hypothetical protein